MNDKNSSITVIHILVRLVPMAFAAAPLLFISISVLGIFHGISIGLNTWVTQHFFDAVTDAVNGVMTTASIAWLAGALCAIVIGTEVINGAHNFLGSAYFKKAIGPLSNHIHRKAARLDPISYEMPSRLDDLNKANEGMMNSLGLLSVFITLFTFYLPYFLFMGFYLYTLKPVLAFSLLLIFIPVVINQLIKGVVFARLEDEAAPLRREYEYYEKCIGAREYFKETRVLGAVTFFKDMYLSTLKLFNKKRWQAEFRTGLLELGMKLLTLLGYFGVLYLLFNALLKGEISIGAFAAVFASIGLMFNIMEEIISRHIGNMLKDLGTVRNFFRFLDMPERKGKDHKLNAGNGIELDQVSFRYPGAQKDAVKNVSFTLYKGETIAIVGANGAGKSTLVHLMTGLYEPSSGVVKVDGVVTGDVSANALFDNVSAVFQNYQRYQMTLKDNVEISDDREVHAHLRTMQLKTAVKKAELNPSERQFPHGYDTMLSREFNGVDLSGGQWQRVAIARGFYRMHDFIVLDEPTAAIDPIEESRIYEKFAEIAEGKTAILVTHRLGSAQIADRIIVMDKGQIVEVGTHAELIRRDGKYAQMYQAQARWYVRSQEQQEKSSS